MMDAAEEAQRWHGYYATQVGRGTRPVFDEAMVRLGAAGAGPNPR